VNADLIALLEKAGLTKPDAELVCEKFAGFGYGLTKAYEGTGDHLLQSDDQMHFLLNRLLRPHSPMKRLNNMQASEVFRSLGLEGYRIVLPKGPLPVVP
jgi:hypothetical protein